MSVVAALADIIWISSLLQELLISSSTPLIHLENMRAVQLAANPIMHSRSKHFELNLHFAQDYVHDKRLTLLHLPAQFQIADILTKLIYDTHFHTFKCKLKVLELPLLSLREDVKGIICCFFFLSTLSHLIQRWIKQGDLNTHFFHSSVKWRRVRNQLHGVSINGKWCDDKDVVKDKVCEFFEDRFARNDACQVRLDNVRFSSISDSDNDLLIGDFFEEEIRTKVWSCDNSKSRSPDGFNFGFLKFCWNILKKDVVLAVKEFAVNGHWPRGSNASFLCLIPKVENPQQFGEFRPISLVGCLYKIISKVLSLRLKKVINKVIDVRQSVFLEGRGLLDNVLVANEVLEEYKRKRKSCVFFKVDYEKAYDSVN